MAYWLTDCPGCIDLSFASPGRARLLGSPCRLLRITCTVQGARAAAPRLSKALRLDDGACVAAFWCQLSFKCDECLGGTESDVVASQTQRICDTLLFLGLFAAYCQRATFVAALRQHAGNGARYTALGHSPLDQSWFRGPWLGAACCVVQTLQTVTTC